MPLEPRTDSSGMTDVVLSSPTAPGRSLNPDRISIWPVEVGGYGIDFTYHGATGYTDARAAEQMLQAAGLTTSFRQSSTAHGQCGSVPCRKSRCGQCSTTSPGKNPAFQTGSRSPAPRLVWPGSRWPWCC